LFNTSRSRNRIEGNHRQRCFVLDRFGLRFRLEHPFRGRVRSRRRFCVANAGRNNHLLPLASRTRVQRSIDLLIDGVPRFHPFRRDIDDVGLVFPKGSDIHPGIDPHQELQLALVQKGRGVHDPLGQVRPQVGYIELCRMIERDLDDIVFADEGRVKTHRPVEHEAGKCRMLTDVQGDLWPLLHLQSGLFKRPDLAHGLFRALGKFAYHVIGKPRRQALPVSRQNIDEQLFTRFQRIDLELALQGKTDRAAVRVAAGDGYVIAEVKRHVIDIDVDGVFEGDPQHAACDDSIVDRQQGPVLEGQDHPAIAFLGLDLEIHRLHGLRSGGRGNEELSRHRERTQERGHQADCRTS
jgi:hypothetical protein